MTKITLAQPWTYRTPLVTIDFPAGEHDVDADIAAQAPKEKRHGHRVAEAGAAGTATAPEG